MSVRVRKPVKKLDVFLSLTNPVKEIKVELQVPKRKKNEDRVTESSDAGTAP